MSRYERVVKELFAECGVLVDGTRSWDPTVHDPRFYQRVLRDGTLGLGESYMDGWWDCDQVDEMIARLSGPRLAHAFRRNPRVIYAKLRSHLRNEGLPSRAARAIQHHYDLGNDLYEAMLDENMIYTCGWWAHATDLETAQLHKLELLCRKLELQPGMRVLDIGCGWGGFARYAARTRGVEVTGITLSPSQLEYAREFCEGLPCTFELRDYRDEQGTYDRILSVGMFEHVGIKNHASYFDVVQRCLAPGGVTLLHTMGRTDTVVRSNDLFITKYIFPGVQVPSVRHIGDAIDGRFTVEDWENLSVSYERTTLAWFENFDRAWPELRPRYGDRFYRMWKYYLLCIAGWYRARLLQLWQIVLAPQGIPGGYSWPRVRTPVDVLMADAETP